ncbi:MAG: hypothetical protein ACLFQK_09975, partial [Fibrobacterota bacterium]
MSSESDLIVLKSDNGAELAESTSGVLRYGLKEWKGLYLRAVCYGKGRRLAMTQPFFNEKSNMFLPVPEEDVPLLPVRFSAESGFLLLENSGKRINRFYSLISGRTILHGTDLKIGAGDNGVFIKAKLEENNVEALKGDRVSAVYADDSVEIFIQPFVNSKKYFQ